MPSGRKYKYKHQYSSLHNGHNIKNNGSEPTSSVTEKLATLRLEQARAEANRERRRRYDSTLTGTIQQQQQQRQQQITMMDPMSYWMQPRPPAMTLPNNDNPPTVTPPYTRPAAGPPPPPSWTAASRRTHASTNSTTSISSRIKQQRRLQLKHGSELSFSVQSLMSLCCCQLADTLSSSSSSYTSQLAQQFKCIPSHVKQILLYEWSFLGNDGDRSLLTDNTLTMFQKTEYEELWLEGSCISLERLIQAFWKVDMIPMTTTSITTKQEEPVDDWEDLLLDDEKTGNERKGDSNDDIPQFILDLNQQEETGQWLHLYQVMKVLRPEIENVIYTPRVSYTLSTPFLGRTLVSLNISFMHLTNKTPWITLAYLVATTVPNLLWLYSAGCFDMIQGPPAMMIFSRGLRKLKFWDLGYYDWLQPDLLTSVIDWGRDLRELNTLCLTNNNNNNEISLETIRRWFKEHQLSRIIIS
ncbi:uncharacterized protein BX664DRAFT_99705 [Halteromyces radiatus]|uniref:uncharacterized protein n=1 Tax=Halteromyces radiatus TaxID=101107 RepID=UPI00221F4EEA|nr:uncharacterized protein BX664DRAFT_99705 [Halteromyces radiatus]KAI8093054.1 hypothetical protein BX664DRAFT_99705 [Halteromyces radiatus]